MHIIISHYYYSWSVRVHFSSCRAGEGGPGTYVASGYSVYEEENERLQEGLKAKVNVLKSVSRNHNCSFNALFLGVPQIYVTSLFTSQLRQESYWCFPYGPYYSLYSTSNSDLCWFLQLSIDIGTEVKYHNKMLDEMVSFTFGLLSPGKRYTLHRRTQYEHLGV